MWPPRPFGQKTAETGTAFPRRRGHPPRAAALVHKLTQAYVGCASLLAAFVGCSSLLAAFVGCAVLLTASVGMLVASGRLCGLLVASGRFCGLRGASDRFSGLLVAYVGWASGRLRGLRGASGRLCGDARRLCNAKVRHELRTAHQMDRIAQACVAGVR